MTDAALVERALQGDGRAFGLLVDRHAPACLRFATRMLGDRDDAEDAAQETFVRAHRALPRYEEREGFRSWLFAILVNRCRTMLARRARHEAVVVADEALLDLAADGAEEAVAGMPALVAGEWRATIARALGALPAEQREAFLLHHVEELSYEEMMAVTGVGRSALKMRVKRACDRLRILLQEGGDVG